MNTAVNGYPASKRNGFIGISDVPAFFTNSPGAFTRIHLVDSVNATSNPSIYAQQLGYRLWQRNGVTMTGNSDQCYIGAKYNGNDSSDLVLQWSDKQRLRRPRSTLVRIAGVGRGSRHDTCC